MAKDTIGWRPVFDWIERAVGSRVENTTRADEFADFVTLTKRVEKVLRDAYLKTTADALHRANVPAWSDVLKLAEQVTTLERKVRDLSILLEKQVKPSRRRSSSGVTSSHRPGGRG